MMAYDRRLEPRVGERVPYVIVYGMPGVPLIQLVRRPMEVLLDPSLRLNATYYITKQILPPLGRLFQLIGVDVFGWYQELPRVSGRDSFYSFNSYGNFQNKKRTLLKEKALTNKSPATIVVRVKPGWFQTEQDKHFLLPPEHPIRFINEMLFEVSAFCVTEHYCHLLVNIQTDRREQSGFFLDIDMLINFLF